MLFSVIVFHACKAALNTIYSTSKWTWYRCCYYFRKFFWSFPLSLSRFKKVLQLFNVVIAAKTVDYFNQPAARCNTSKRAPQRFAKLYVFSWMNSLQSYWIQFLVKVLLIDLKRFAFACLFVKQFKHSNSSVTTEPFISIPRFNDCFVSCRWDFVSAFFRLYLSSKIPKNSF